MKKFLSQSLLLMIALLLSTAAPAFDGGSVSGFQADSEFRIAEKAYRKAIKNYGKNMQEFPAKEKASACQKLHWAIYDNRHQYNKEGAFGQMKYKKKIQKLEKYNTALGCTN